jgi:hypothetical protein
VPRYEADGILRAVRETGRAVDMLLVDAHLGYYAARTVLERLRQDVIGPARARYESIRLIGVSMGDWVPCYARVGILDTGPAGAVRQRGAHHRGHHRGRRPAVVESEPYRRARVSTYQEELWRWLKAYEPASREYPRIVLG